MKWHFIPQLACYVETGVTQRDQFRNDEVDLYDTIVREAVQNSLDATESGNQTRVVFKWVTLGEGDGEDNKFIRSLLDTQIEHARSSGLELDEVDFSYPTALVIEDFGTRGLTGSTNSWDDGNFSDFWRRHGKSHKTGTSRGRWGLGKLVYSSSSLVAAFFGLTVRSGDPKRYLMGQTVLDLRTHEGKRYPPHAYFSEMLGDDLESQIPIPNDDEAYVERFSTTFGLTRTAEPGLSVVIPFPQKALQPDNMIGVAIVNYFYPILSGQLVLAFNDLTVDAGNIRELAHIYAKGRIHDIDPLFDFIEEANEAIRSNQLLTLKESWIEDTRLDEEDFEDNDLETIRAAFGNRKLVGIRLPLSIKRKPNQETQDTEFYVFVKRPEEIGRGVDLYVRGGLTLPSESKFGDRKAFGAMIANDEVISAFLGDAENPAHTKWIFNAEKLRKNYVAPEKRLRVIKNAVINFYDMLVQAEEEVDEKALSKYFFTREPESPGKADGKPDTTPPDDEVNPPASKPKVARLVSIDSGFSIRRAAGASEADYPVRLKVRAAYDTASGNPFKKYDPLDFTFSKDSGLDIGATKGTVSLISGSGNELEFEVSGERFQIDVTGFDSNRDLLVKLKAETLEAE